MKFKFNFYFSLISKTKGITPKKDFQNSLKIVTKKSFILKEKYYALSRRYINKPIKNIRANWTFNANFNYFPKKKSLGTRMGKGAGKAQAPLTFLFKNSTNFLIRKAVEDSEFYFSLEKLFHRLPTSFKIIKKYQKKSLYEDIPLVTNVN